MAFSHLCTVISLCILCPRLIVGNSDTGELRTSHQDDFKFGGIPASKFPYPPPSISSSYIPARPKNPKIYYPPAAPALPPPFSNFVHGETPEYRPHQKDGKVLHKIPSIPSQPLDFSSGSSSYHPAVKPQESVPFHDANRRVILGFVNPSRQIGQKIGQAASAAVAANGHVFGGTKSSTQFLTSHDNDDVEAAAAAHHSRNRRRERSVNTNGNKYTSKNWKKSQDDGIHGSNFPDVDAEFLPSESREVILFRVSASGLPNADLFGGEADPFIQISYSNGSSGDHFERFARTATLTNDHEPSWDDIVKFETYLRGTVQTWKFEVRDHDANDWDDLIGFAFINVDDCVWESRQSRIFLDGSACSAQITNGNGVLSVQIL